MAFIHIAINVFNHNNGIIHKKSQCKNQGKQDNQVDFNAQHTQDDEGKKHGNRNGKSHKQSVSGSQEIEQAPG